MAKHNKDIHRGSSGSKNSKLSKTVTSKPLVPIKSKPNSDLSVSKVLVTMLKNQKKNKKT